MKKWQFTLLTALFMSVLLLLGSCGKKYENEPSLAGTVTETGAGKIQVRITEPENERGKLITVPVKANAKDSAKKLSAGDEVRVYYDGRWSTSYYCGTTESYSVTAVEHVYKIVLVPSAE